MIRLRENWPKGDKKGHLKAPAALTRFGLVALCTALFYFPMWDLEAKEAKAIFAGGCFWCMEQAFDGVKGVTETIAGYIGGKIPNPTYNQVVAGQSGHREAVLVHYNDRRVSYDELLEVFWRNVDPLDNGGQFCDRGSSYTTAIFYLNKEQQEKAKASRQALIDSKVLEGRVLTPIIKAKEFYAAESYHQNYYIRNPLKYTYYKYGCRRPQRLKELWGDTESKS